MGRAVNRIYPRLTGYIHLIVRNQHTNKAEQIPNFTEIQTQIVNYFENKKNNDKIEIIQLHTYISSDTASCLSTRVDHLHIIYWAYKSDIITQNIFPILKQSDVYYTWSSVNNISGILKYLLQEDINRKILHQSNITSEMASVINNAVKPYGYDSDEDDEFIPSKKIKPFIEGLKTWQLSLRDIIRKYRAIKSGQLASMIQKHGTDEERQWLSQNIHNPQMTQKIEQELELDRLTYDTEDWENILASTDEDVFKYHCNNPDKVLSINNSKCLIKMIIKHNGYKCRELVNNIWKIINNITGKLNTIYIQGEKNAGKTLFATSICRSLIYYASLIKYGTNGRRGDDRFALSHCIGCRVILGNEAYISDDNLALSLNLFEGNPQDVDVKFKTPQRLGKIPLIVTNNLGPTAYLTSATSAEHSSAIMERIYLLKFKTYPFLADYAGWELHPYVWKYLIDEYVDKKPMLNINNVELQEPSSSD